ncbi:hypothetical protein pb186bvf_016772 [Paramecium bursaria]
MQQKINDENGLLLIQNDNQSKEDQKVNRESLRQLFKMFQQDAQTLTKKILQPHERYTIIIESMNIFRQGFPTLFSYDDQIQHLNLEKFQFYIQLFRIISENKYLFSNQCQIEKLPNQQQTQVELFNETLEEQTQLE